MKSGKIFAVFSVVLFLVGMIFGTVMGQDQAEVVVLGNGDFEFDAALLQKGVPVSSLFGDLRVRLKDVHFTDGLMSFTLAFEASSSASGVSGSSRVLFLNGQALYAVSGSGLEKGPFTRTETYAWYDSPAVYAPSVFGMDWKSFRVSFEDIFFTFEGGNGPVYVAPAEGYVRPFVFHNPETDPYNADGYAPTVDQRGIHTFGDSFDISLGGGLVGEGGAGADDLFSFNIITKSDLLNNYGSQEGMWFNGEQRMAGGGSISFDGDGNPELPADGKFTDTDHFTWQVPEEFPAEGISLTLWAGKVTFEIDCTGESVDPETGYTWRWDGTLTDRDGKSVYPLKLVTF